MNTKEKIIVAVPLYCSSNPYQRLFYNELRKYGIDVIEKFVFNARNIIAKRDLVDAIHFHWAPVEDKDAITGFINILGFTIGIFLCKVFRIKLVWTAHNILPHETNLPGMQYLKRFILVRMADLIIVHYHYAAKQLENAFRISGDKIVCMHTGLYDGAYPDTPYLDRKSARSVLNVKESNKVFLFFGLFREYKNIEGLVAAFKCIHGDDLTLLVAGRGVDIEYENQIRAICKSDDRIICETGYIPDNRVELYFKSADCAVLPYKNIYTSGVAMLALTFKIPIITRKTPFSEEYLNEYNSILIDGADEDSIKEGMTKYILNMEKLIVTEDFKAKYEWKTIVKKLLEDDRVRSVFFK